MVRFLRATEAAFLMFLRAACFCFGVAIVMLLLNVSARLLDADPR